MELQEFRIKRDHLPYLSFTGQLIGSACRDEYSMGIDIRIYLYLTKGGKYICQKIILSRWQGDSDYYTAKVCDTLDEVFDFFGYSDLAYELYRDAGIDVSQEIL